jgi:hypothetical protein
MATTFAPTSDRPRLFDDRPKSRARRPGPVAPGRGAEDRAPTTPDFEDRAPATSGRAAEDHTPATPGRAAEDHAPATPGFDLTPAGAELAPRDAPPAGLGASRDALTLDHLISGTWDNLAAHRTVSCPVCHGQMAPRYGSGAHPVGGRCRRCGSSLG